MAISISPSASRHGISEARIRHIIATCPCPLYPPPDDPGAADLVVFLGPDANGVPLEVVGIESADGGLVVIHAMRLRRQYAGDYERVMRCH